MVGTTTLLKPIPYTLVISLIKIFSLMTEQELEKCIDILRNQGVNTLALSWSTLKDIAKAMVEYKNTK